MERTNAIKVIGYTPILIELCIPYFFTIFKNAGIEPVVIADQILDIFFSLK